MPYLLSGGATGIGLIGFGVGMMIMAQLRTEGRRLAERLEAWRSSVPGAAEAAKPAETNEPTVGAAEVPSAGAAEIPLSGGMPNGVSPTPLPSPIEQQEAPAP